MAPDDIAILLAAQKALKEDVREMLQDYKQDHEAKANERWNIVINKIENIDTRCFNNIPIYSEMKKHLETSEDNKKFWRDKYFWIIGTVGGWSVTILLFIFKK